MKTTQDINKKVDKLLKSTSHSRRLAKRGLLVIGVLLTSAILVGAGTILYYSQVSGSHGVGHVWVWNDNIGGDWGTDTTMQEYDIDYTTSGTIPGDTEFFNFNITLSGNSNANKGLKFVTFDDPSNGVNLSIYKSDFAQVTNNSVVVFSPGEKITFYYNVTIDPYTPEGSYTTKLTLLTG